LNPILHVAYLGEVEKSKPLETINILKLNFTTVPWTTIAYTYTRACIHTQNTPYMHYIHVDLHVHVCSSACNTQTHTAIHVHEYANTQGYYIGLA